MRVFYCHGLPGGPGELRFGWPEHRERPVVLPPLGFDAFDRAAPAGERVRLIGFSLGAQTALMIAARHPHRVAELNLISPAAPLAAGDLADMAGALVFRAAMLSPAALGALTRAQALLARAAPGLLLRGMFVNAPPSDRRLLEDDAARSVLVQGLERSLGPEREAYQAGLLAYVARWDAVLDSVRVPVRVDHGDADRWVPLKMARRLADALGDLCILHVHHEVGHYGTLQAVLPLLARLRDHDDR